MPAGMVTVMLRWRRMVPLPPHLGQGSVMILPVPPHLGQGELVRMEPSIVCWMRVTWPVPWHWSQVLGLVPGFAPEPPQVSQASSRVMLISFLQPKIASSKLMVRLYRRSSPRTGPFAAWRVLPPKPPKLPKMLSKISSKPPAPPV